MLLDILLAATFLAWGACGFCVCMFTHRQRGIETDSWDQVRRPSPFDPVGA
jgi:hypothetical protein